MALIRPLRTWPDRRRRRRRRAAGIALDLELGSQFGDDGLELPRLILEPHAGWFVQQPDGDGGQLYGLGKRYPCLNSGVCGVAVAELLSGRIPAESTIQADLAQVPPDTCALKHDGLSYSPIGQVPGFPAQMGNLTGFTGESDSRKVLG